MSELKKKSFRSIIAVPIKVEMQPVEHQSNNVLTVDELALQIDEATKGKAKVDSKYVDFTLDGRRHLFDYDINYSKFLENMSYIIKQAKSRPKQDRYKNSHPMIIQ